MERRHNVLKLMILMFGIGAPACWLFADFQGGGSQIADASLRDGEAPGTWCAAQDGSLITCEDFTVPEQLSISCEARKDAGVFEFVDGGASSPPRFLRVRTFADIYGNTGCFARTVPMKSTVARVKLSVRFAKQMPLFAMVGRVFFAARTENAKDRGLEILSNGTDIRVRDPESPSSTSQLAKLQQSLGAFGTWHQLVMDVNYSTREITLAVDTQDPRVDSLERSIPPEIGFYIGHYRRQLSNFEFDVDNLAIESLP